jgi:hypothetical protein
MQINYITAACCLDVYRGTYHIRRSVALSVGDFAILFSYSDLNTNTYDWTELSSNEALLMANTGVSSIRFDTLQATNNIEVKVVDKNINHYLSVNHNLDNVIFDNKGNLSSIIDGNNGLSISNSTLISGHIYFANGTITNTTIITDNFINNIGSTFNNSDITINVEGIDFTLSTYNFCDITLLGTSPVVFGGAGVGNTIRIKMGGVYDTTQFDADCLANGINLIKI